MFRRISRLALAGAAIGAVFMAGAALADIKAFNAAVKAGDHKTASAEAREIWKTWDKSKADTALMAREFGFTSYMAGDYAAARDFGQFLKDQGASLATPDDQPATSRVLLAAANFRLEAKDGTRQALHDALKAREAVKGIDFTTVLAAEALYRADWASGVWIRAAETGGLAWRLLDRAGDPLALRALDARAAAATAGFMSGPDKDDYESIVDAHDAVVAKMDAALNPRTRLTFAPLKYQLQAWASSVTEYFRASQQTGSNIPVRLKARELAQPASAIFPEAVLTGGQCQQLEPVAWPDLRYPQPAMFSGMVGTVVMKLDVDATGRVTNWETLAAVPARNFAKAVEEAMPSVRFQKAKGEAPNCSLARTSYVFSVLFRMG
jgi:TonB family protein